ncbi:ATP-binding protein [Cryobacterium sp. BB736]|uniref:ATP-binding protein n=1 Tax=Cryobacterium sp. BB736 TaxID=2746963 RepID=UPI001D0BEC80|nr:ATP-binding protein [Cryobacterium sp. BB736]
MKPETPGGGSTAASLDGRHFQFEGGRGATFDPGGFVTLRSHEGSAQLGQVHDVILGKRGTIHGTGTILGVIMEGRVDDSRPVTFATAQMEKADAATFELLYGDTGQLLHIGSHLGSEGTPAHLLPRRFNRHTFWCGQSGSGKTYALGVVLEQLLVCTRLPIVVLDPNADFVKLREPSGSEDSDESRILSERNIRILRPSSSNTDPLRVRYLDLPVRAKAAILRLDPLENRAEYNELMHLEETLGTMDTAKIVPRLRERGTGTSAALAARIENLRLTDWSVWAGKLEPVTEVINARPDATVLDLGGFEFPDESLVVAMAVLEDLWARREERRPILIVIDEAHNLCSPDETSPLHVAVRERIIQIAAEGRKFGLWLLLSTQRPSRIHSSIISQCDNLALMKMTSPIDLDELARIFGFVPLAMLARSPRFRQGEALFAGSFVPAPTMVTMGARLTREGGADVGVPFRT